MVPKLVERNSLNDAQGASPEVITTHRETTGSEGFKQLDAPEGCGMRQRYLAQGVGKEGST